MEDREYRAMYEAENSHWWFIGRRLFVGRLFARFGIGARTLHIADIGAGTGGMEPFLSAFGRVVGIEQHPLGRALAKKRGILLKKGSAHGIPLPRSSQDVVCFFDVLYHKNVRVRRALSEAYRTLKPGGWLVITSCAVPWLYGPHDVATHGKTRFYLPYLAQEVTASGFTIRKASYLFFLTFPLYILTHVADTYGERKQYASRVAQVTPLVNTFLLFLCRMESVALSYISYPWGSSLVLIAQKPM